MVSKRRLRELEVMNQLQELRREQDRMYQRINKYDLDWQRAVMKDIHEALLVHRSMIDTILVHLQLNTNTGGTDDM